MNRCPPWVPAIISLLGGHLGHLGHLKQYIHVRAGGVVPKDTYRGARGARLAAWRYSQ